MAARFWIGGTGNWDASTTTHWASSSGGAGGQSVPTTSDTVTFDSNSGTGTCTLTATANISTMTFSGSVTLAPSAQTINVSGTGTAWNFTGGAFTPGTSTINFSGAGVTMVGGGKSYATVNFTGSGAVVISGANTYATLSRTGTAVVGDSFTLPAATTTTCTTLSINGNSTKNRLLVTTSNVFTGKATLLVSTTVTATYVDLKGITGSGAASWNLSGITGGSGDCSDNSGITFTSPQSNYWSSGTGNFSTTGNWFLATNGGGGAGRIPLPQDTAVLDSNSFTAGSQTLTLDMPRIGSLTCTGVTNNPTFSLSITATFFGNITLASGLTLAVGTTTFSSGNFTTAQSWTTAGATITISSGFIATAPGLGGATLTFQDNITIPGALQSATGTLAAANNVTITAKTFSLTSLGLWKLGTGVSWVFNGTGTVMSIAAAPTIGTGTIQITDTTSATKTLTLGGFTFNNMQLSGGSGTIAITGANTFNNFTILAPATLVTFPISTTQKFNTFNALGSSGNTITVNSATNGTQHTLSASGGVISCNYLVLRDSNAAGGAAWFAGANSTSTSDNSGWIFSNAPTGDFFNFM